MILSVGHDMTSTHNGERSVTNAERSIGNSDRRLTSNLDLLSQNMRMLILYTTVDGSLHFVGFVDPERSNHDSFFVFCPVVCILLHAYGG